MRDQNLMNKYSKIGTEKAINYLKYFSACTICDKLEDTFSPYDFKIMTFNTGYTAFLETKNRGVNYYETYILEKDKLNSIKSLKGENSPNRYTVYYLNTFKKSETAFLWNLNKVFKTHQIVKINDELTNSRVSQLEKEYKNKKVILFGKKEMKDFTACFQNNRVLKDVYLLPKSAAIELNI